MAEQIFTNEPPPPVPPKRKLSTATKLALGCGILLLIGAGSCGGLMLWCGHAVSSIGNQEWADLRKVANDLATDAGAQAEYASHPKLSDAYPTADDFVGAVKLWRPDLEPLPEHMPAFTSGKISIQSNSANGKSNTRLAYGLASGKHLVGTWRDGQLVDLQLE